jgi:hypothetical protein
MTSLASRQNNCGNNSTANIAVNAPSLPTNRWGRQKSNEMPLKNGNSKSKDKFSLNS